MVGKRFSLTAELQLDALQCAEWYGTHRCSQLFTTKHTMHYCVCTGEDNQRWKTGARAPLSAYNPKLITAKHVARLRETGLIK